MTRSETVIATQELGRRFGDIVAVDQLTLDVYRGEVLGILGHNGAGKTTTVRLLNGILEPSAGKARVLGQDPVAQGPALRRRTGVLTETPSLDERLTGRENLQIYAELYDVPASEIPGRVAELLATFDLGARANDKVGDYSKGMKQRLALARALVHEPEILFLDEPTAGLDPVASRRVHDLITRLSEEEHRTVFLCTHNLTEAQRLCDRVAVMEHGRLVALGTPAELAATLGRSLHFEIEVEPGDLPIALQIVGSSMGGVDPQLENGKITIQRAARQAIPDLISSLAAAGVHIYQVRSEEPSLEDVYFGLHDAGLPEAGMHNANPDSEPEAKS